jgi:hypothetical protein
VVWKAICVGQIQDLFLNLKLCCAQRTVKLVMFMYILCSEGVHLFIPQSGQPVLKSGRQPVSIDHYGGLLFWIIS